MTKAEIHNKELWKERMYIGSWFLSHFPSKMSARKVGNILGISHRGI